MLEASGDAVFAAHERLPCPKVHITEGLGDFVMGLYPAQLLEAGPVCGRVEDDVLLDWPLQFEEAR